MESVQISYLSYSSSRTLVQCVSGERRPDGPVLTGELFVAKYAICYLSNNVTARIFVYFAVSPGQNHGLYQHHLGGGGGGGVCFKMESGEIWICSASRHSALLTGYTAPQPKDAQKPTPIQGIFSLLNSNHSHKTSSV